jgi:thiol-disulfide isomerase/thioredoxin
LLLKKFISLLVSFLCLITVSGCFSAPAAPTKPFLLSGVEALRSLPHEKPTLIHFWSSWCRICLVELSAVNGLSEWAEKEGVQVVAVAINDNLQSAMRVYRNKLPNTTVILDDGSLEKIFSVPAVPYTIALDPSGKRLPLLSYPNKTPVDAIDGYYPWGASWGKDVVQALIKHPE